MEQLAIPLFGGIFLGWIDDLSRTSLHGQKSSRAGASLQDGSQGGGGMDQGRGGGALSGDSGSPVDCGWCAAEFLVVVEPAELRRFAACGSVGSVDAAGLGTLRESAGSDPGGEGGGCCGAVHGAWRLAVSGDLLDPVRKQFQVQRSLENEAELVERVHLFEVRNHAMGVLRVRTRYQYPDGTRIDVYIHPQINWATKDGICVQYMVTDFCETLRWVKDQGKDIQPSSRDAIMRLSGQEASLMAGAFFLCVVSPEDCLQACLRLARSLRLVAGYLTREKDAEVNLSPCAD